MTTTDDGLSRRGERTRQAIAEAARSLFLERGYEATTMRTVAERAGVSLGNAYYYFASKDHLVQAFYTQLQIDHAAAVGAKLLNERTFSRRLESALLTWVDVARPLHPFAGAFFRVAAEPSSPLSPFSAESSPARQAALTLYRQVVTGSDLSIPADLREELPELLWLAHMGIVLFWVHDASPDQQRTQTLIRGSVPLITKALRLTKLPGVRGVATDLTRIVASLRA